MECDRNCFECANTYMGTMKLKDETKIFEEDVEILAPVYSCIKPELGNVAMYDELPCAQCQFATPLQIPYKHDTSNMSDKQKRALAGCKCAMEVIHCEFDPDNVYRLPTMRCAMGIPREDSEEPHIDCKKVPYKKDIIDWNFNHRQL